jgi:hypothetical protein
MASYFQMGHDTENLVGEEGLGTYAGIILSPVNRTPEELGKDIATFRGKGDFDIVLDPQLYFPRSDRGELRKHPHFASDFDTADLSSANWWKEHTSILAQYALGLGVTSVATPAFIPRIWDDGFYSLCAELSSALMGNLAGKDVKVLTSVVIGTSDLTHKDKPSRIASILSNKPSDGYYVVFVSDIDPRREIADEDVLFGMLCLIRELRASGLPVLVSHCSSDMILFKYAEAEHCATGKFFNLRRFTKSRYEEPAGGGGQLPYSFEHSLLAFLRQADLLRLQRDGHASMLSNSHSRNCWSEKIQESLRENPEEPWLRLGWRQYLAWFAEAEKDLSGEREKATAWLKSAEENWLALEDDSILLDEPRNNGAWVRPWRQSLIRLKKSTI